MSSRAGPFPAACILAVLLTTAACASSPPSSPTAPANPTPTPMPPAAGTATPDLPASLTPAPSQTPSRTPKPTPTLPDGEDFTCLPGDGERASGVVAGVIDGDTIVVQVGFQKFTVRYIGIDTPETNIDTPERMGVEARSRNRDLVSGERVILVSDPEIGNTDIYDRLLRYVLVDDIHVNVVLVREGLARYSASGNACGAILFAAEQQARSDQIGIWSNFP